MSYAKLADLPDAIKALPTAAQKIWMGAFNASFADAGETSAFKIAWASVNRKFKKDATNSWVAKEAHEFEHDDPDWRPLETAPSFHSATLNGTPTQEQQIYERLYVGLADISEDLSAAEGDTRRVWMTLIESGWSLNDNHYGVEQIHEIAAMIPEQRKMFVDHLKAGQAKHERKFMEWAGTILEHRVVTEGGPAGPKTKLRAKVEIADDEMWKRIKRFPEEVGASVDLWAQIAEGEAEGRKGRLVKKVTKYNSTDFVLFPAAGGKVERIAASYGWPVITETESLFRWLAEAEANGMDKHDPKTIDAVIKHREMYRRWWDIKDALDTLLRKTANDESMTDPQKKTKFGQLFDEFKTKATEMDLQSVFSKNMMYGKQSPAPAGEGDEPMSEIKTLAGLTEAFPGLVTELRDGITKAVKAEFDTDAKTTALEAERDKAKTEAATAGAQLAEAQKKLDAQEASAKLLAHKALVEKKLAEAKLPERAVTDLFYQSLVEAKDETAVAALIADRKVVVEAAGAAPAAGPAWRPKGVDSTGSQPKVDEKVFEQRVGAAFDRM